MIPALGVRIAKIEIDVGIATVIQDPSRIQRNRARRVALAVHSFAGQPDLVVKRLPGVRGALRIFGGASILDTGAVALILDLPALLSRTSP